MTDIQREKLSMKSTLFAGWEYLMPKPKERAAGYIRESDPTLADSTTIDSQAKAVRTHCQKEGYDYNTTDHEYREAISAYLVPYVQRPKLMELLRAARRHEFDVLVLSEIRALSRKQVEVFVIYDMLQKCGVRIETIQEKFEDSAIGRYILATRAMVAELERENTYMRTERGKRDRLENGNLPGHPKPAYGYVFIDTDREAKARYSFNNKIIYVDSEGTEWTEVKVVLYIFDLVKQGESLRGIVTTLNGLGVPPPTKPRKGEPHWQAGTIYKIITNRVYIGEVYVNKYRREGKRLVKRSLSEQVLLPPSTAPALLDKETFEAIQKQLEINRQDALRNNRHPKDLGILRTGYCHCGICGRNMNVKYHNPTPTNDRRTPEYFCQRKTGRAELTYNHNTIITVNVLDRLAWGKAIEAIQNPAMVRARVSQLREENKPIVDTEDIMTTIDELSLQIQNLLQLAQYAKDKDTIDRLGKMMNELEDQKRKTESMLYDIEEDEEERAEIEAEIVKFEKWADKVRPLLGNPTYEASYEEMRLAVRILGIHATIFPAKGDFPFRAQVDMKIPDIMSKVKYCATIDQSRISCGQTECSTGKSGETL